MPLLSLGPWPGWPTDQDLPAQPEPLSPAHGQAARRREGTLPQQRRVRNSLEKGGEGGGLGHSRTSSLAALGACVLTVASAPGSATSGEDRGDLFPCLGRCAERASTPGQSAGVKLRKKLESVLNSWREENPTRA